jgi:antitoxin MazE
MSHQGECEPREAWSAASFALAANGDDELVWPEFANEADEEMTW